MRNAGYASKDTPKSPQLASSRDSCRFYRSSGARHAPNRSGASVLPIRARARRSRFIARSRCASGKSCARRSAFGVGEERLASLGFGPGTDDPEQLFFAVLHLAAGYR